MSQYVELSHPLPLRQWWPYMSVIFSKVILINRSLWFASADVLFLEWFNNFLIDDHIPQLPLIWQEIFSLAQVDSSSLSVVISLSCLFFFQSCCVPKSVLRWSLVLMLCCTMTMSLSHYVTTPPVQTICSPLNINANILSIHYLYPLSSIQADGSQFTRNTKMPVRLKMTGMLM